MKNKFLFAPPLIFLAVFLIEKIFLLPSVRDYTQNWKKFEPYIYESRVDLFNQLVKEYPARKASGEKPGFVFGTSRSGELAEKNFGEKKGLYVYNFSTPLASYPQHYYWLLKTVEAGIEPEFVILETDFIMFTETSMQYTLAYSLDIPFVLEHTDYFGAESSGDPENFSGRGFEYRLSEKFMLKKMFAMYRYPVDLKSIAANRKEQFPGMTGISINRKARELIAKSNRENLGGMENTFLLVTIPEDKIRMDVEDKFAKFNLKSFHPSRTQVIFFRKTLELLAEKNIPLILFRPLLSEPFREKLSEYGIEEISQTIVHRSIQSIKTGHPEFRTLNFEPQYEKDIKCRQFMDASHLSAGCFPELIGHLKKQIILLKK